MKNMRLLYDNWADSATITAYSAATGHPVSNVQHIHKTRVWRSTGLSNEWVKFDFGTAKAIEDLVIEYHNFTGSATVKIQANASDSWGSPSVDTALSVTSDRIVKQWTSAQTYQWWRILVSDGTNTDGYVQMGRVFLGVGYPMVKNFDNAYVRTVVDPSEKQYSVGGQLFVNQLPTFEHLVYQWTNLGSADITKMRDIFKNYVGQHTPYFLSHDPDSGSAYMFYVVNVKDWGVPHVFMESLFNLTIEVQEAR